MYISTLFYSSLLAIISSVLASPAPQMLAGASALSAPPAISESVAGAGAAPGPAASNSGAVAAGTSTSTATAAGSTSSGVIGSSPGGGGVPVWVIKVGSQNNDLVFSPNEIKANPGDMVQFQFYSKNHSVASSTFDAPCVPEMQTNPSATNAFWSGFMPTDQQGEFVFTMMVKDTNPVYYYCAQGMHCQSGMVGAINPPATGNTLQAYTQKAMQAQQNISPSGEASTSSGTSGSTTGSTTGSAPAASATKSAASNVRIEWWPLALSAIIGVVLL